MISKIAINGVKYTHIFTHVATLKDAMSNKCNRTGLVVGPFNLGAYGTGPDLRVLSSFFPHVAKFDYSPC